MKKRLFLFVGAVLLCIGLASCSSSNEKTVQLHDEEDIVGLTVATATGSCYDIELSKRNDIHLLLFNREADLLNSLLTGLSDVIVHDETVFNSEIRRDYGVKIAFKGEQEFPTALMFRKDPEGEQLAQAMNTVQNNLQEDGTMQKLKEFWLTDAYLDNRTYRHVPVETEGKALRVVCITNMAPISFMIGDEWYGFEIDLLRALSTYLHRPLEIDLYDASGMIALRNGMADILIGGMFVTPERQEEFRFSDPYHNFHPAYYVLDKEAQAGASGDFWERFKTSLYKNLIEESRWKYITSGLLETLKITLCAILLGSVLGVGLCAMTRSRRKWLHKIAGFYNWFMAGIPILVLLLILFYAVFARSGLHPATVAIIAFAMDFAAGAGDIYNTSLDSVPHGQTEGGLALGFTRIQTFFHIVFPQALNHGLPLYQSLCVSLLKGTSIVGYIAIQDLTRAGDLIRSRTFDPYIPLLVITVLYFVLAWLLAVLLKLAMPKQKKL